MRIGSSGEDGLAGERGEVNEFEELGFDISRLVRFCLEEVIFFTGSSRENFLDAS